MARKQSGSKRWSPLEGSWRGRIRDAQGKRTPWCDLGTDNETLAAQKLAQWIETGIPPRAKARESFALAARRIVAEQKASGFAGAGDRWYRIETYALPRIGHFEIEQIEQHHLKTILADMVKLGLLVDTVHHMRTDLSKIFKTLVGEGSLRHCVATGVELPDGCEHDARPRKVVSDEHVVLFLRRRGTTGELEMLVLVARWVGGQRTSDIHAGDWSHVDTVTWKTMRVRRPKTEAKAGTLPGHKKGRRRASRSFEFTEHDIPSDVVGPLRAWWEAHGRPLSGPIFPARRGKNAGQRKVSRGISYAERWRDALWEERIASPLPGYDSAVGDERRKYCAYQSDTDETRKTDFHSIRSAYITGLARAGVNEQMAMIAAGHGGDSRTHRGYLKVDEIAVPASALPSLALPEAPPSTPPPAPLPPAPPSETSRLESVLTGLSVLLERALGAGAAAASPGPIDPAPGSIASPQNAIDPAIAEQIQRRARVDSNHRPTAPEAGWDHLRTQKDSEASAGVIPHETPSEQVVTHALGHTITSQSPLDSLCGTIQRAVGERDWGLARSLIDVAEAHVARLAATAPVSLELARAKREGSK